MGLFANLSYSAGRWATGRPVAVPFPLVDVHDGGIATIDYRSADASGGRFFLGYEPRFYFDDPDAAPPVDVATEAQGIARWARESTDTDVDPAELGALLASPDGAPPTDERVQDTVDRLIGLLGLPAIEWPTDDDQPAG